MVGFGGSHNDFSGVLFPVMNGEGDATYLQNCSVCHVNSTEQNDLPLMTSLNQVTDPQGWINPVQATLRLAADVTFPRPRRRTSWPIPTTLGEGCAVCHASGAQFAVDAEHVQ